MDYIIISAIAAYVLAVVFETTRVIIASRRLRQNTNQRQEAAKQVSHYRRAPMHAHYHVLGQTCLVCGASSSEDCDAGLHS